jgi:hypothetical protein
MIAQPVGVTVPLTGTLSRHPLAIALHVLIGVRRYSVQPIRHAIGAL